MKKIPETVIERAVDLIVTTRDFCGDEREAVREFAIETGYRAERALLYRIANFRANAVWNRHKIAAGVPAKYCF